MAGIGIQELLIVLVVVLVIFGAGKLPSIMRDLGVGLREMRSAAHELEVWEEGNEGDSVGSPRRQSLE